MPPFFKNAEKARAFFENLGVVFTPEGLPIFPRESPRVVTSQDLAVLSKEIAYQVAEAELPLRAIVQPIGALVCITGTTNPIGAKEDRRRRIWETQKAPSVVSQLTASLGPDLYWLQNDRFGKMVRVFASYDPNPKVFGIPEKPVEAVRAMEGLRTLFVADVDTEIERLARLIKSCLSRAVHGESLKLSEEDQQELTELPETDREEAEHQIMSGKRSLLTSGVLFLVRTRSETEVVKILKDHIGFTPRIWTICDNAKPAAKLA